MGLISLLAFGQPHIPSPNDKQRDRGVCLEHVCCRLFLARETGGRGGAGGRGRGEGPQGATTRGHGQERPTPRGAMPTQQPPSPRRGTVSPQGRVRHAAHP